MVPGARPAPDHGAAITQDSRGYIWIGTQDGLARFDGVSFKPYLAGNWATALINGPDGTLWVGTNKGMAYYQPDEMHPLKAAPGERGVNREADVRALAFSSERLYAATNSGLLRVDKDGLHQDPALPKESLYSLLEWHGALWVGGVGKIYIVNGSVKSIEAPGGAGTQVTRLMVYDDALWAGTSRGLFRYTGTEWRRAAGDPPELQLATNTFYVDSDGNFWIATNAGVGRLEGDALKQFVPANEYKPAAQVESLFEDREHSLWLEEDFLQHSKNQIGEWPGQVRGEQALHLPPRGLVAGALRNCALGRREDFGTPARKSLGHVAMHGMRRRYLGRMRGDLRQQLAGDEHLTQINARIAIQVEMPSFIFPAHGQCVFRKTRSDDNRGRIVTKLQGVIAKLCESFANRLRFVAGHRHADERVAVAIHLDVGDDVGLALRFR